MNFHFFLIFSPVSELFERMSSFKANLSIIADLIAVPSIVVIYEVLPAFDAALVMIGWWTLLAYISLRSRKYPLWLKTRVNDQNRFITRFYRQPVSLSQ